MRSVLGLMDVGVLEVWPLFAVLLLGIAVSARRASGRNGLEELAALRRLASMVNRSLDMAQLLRTALEELITLLGMEGGFLRLSGGINAGPPLLVHRGLGRRVVRALGQDEPEAAGTAEDGALLSVLVADLLQEPERDPLREALRGEGFRSFALYPVMLGNRMVGSIGLGSSKPGTRAPWQEETVAAVAEVLGVAVVHAELRDQAAKLSEDLIALQEVNKIISQGFDLEDIIRRIVIEGKRLVKTSQCHLFLLDDARHALVGSASTQAEGFDIRQVTIPLSETNTAISALKGKHTLAVDGTAQPPGSGEALTAELGWKAAILAPLLAKERSIGVLICSDDSRERRFTREEVSRAETLAHQAAIALENARLFLVVSRSQKEWETTFDALQDCVSVHDTSGKVVRANVALARRLRTTPPKVIGRYCSDLYGGAPTASPHCSHARPTQPEELIVEEIEIPAMGGIFQVSVGPWYDKNNRLAGSIHVAKDISHERLLQQQLIQSEKLSAIGELISGVAHELNNPLTGVMGYAQLLHARGDLDERARESLVKINELAMRCQRIVQNLLSFARKQKPARTLTSINEVIQRTVELRSYELQVNNIEIVSNLDPALPRTIADGHQLQQVFLNVITNAEQAMLGEHGHGRLSISTRANTAGDRIVIEISDDGPGIPEQHLTKIFDPFFTTKEVGKGTGLGLSLAYGIIKEHAGDILAHNRPGGGATFAIEIPIVRKMPENHQPPEELMPRPLLFEDVVRGKRILVVDDEEYILDFFTEVFRMVPLHVDTAGNGRAAMEMLKVRDYDLVITDYKMPQMGGRELFEWVREHRPGLARRIIFATGDTVSFETRSFFENTSSRYLSKPFRIEEIREVVRKVLES